MENQQHCIFRTRKDSIKFKPNKSNSLFKESGESCTNFEPSSIFKNEILLKRQIEQVKAKLQNTVSIVEMQERKNKILKELNTFLQNQQREQSEIKKQFEKQQYEINDKLTKKYQYDIKQILHKHNEQIAKINSLKQQANAARSQRVVFSKLFKKLQRQIKDIQETYKSQIIKIEGIKSKCSTRLKCQQFLFIEDDALIEKKQEQEKAPFQYSCQSNQKQNESHLVQVALQTQLQQEPYDKKHLIQKVLILCECNSMQELTEQIYSIQENNQQLRQKILIYNEEVGKIQDQIQALKKVQSISFEDQQQIIFQTVQNYDQILNNSNQIIFQTICKLLNAQQIEIIQKKIQQMFEIKQIKNNKREKNTQNNERLYSIIQKYSKQNQSQKIFDRNNFKQQFIKYNKSKKISSSFYR